MKKILLLLCLLPLFSAAQTKTEEPKFGINFSGFVKSDFFWDSRQTVSIREGHFLLYPAAISRDAQGNDMNDKKSFNFLSIQSRLSGKITGPDAFKAKTSGVIEADFFGNENAVFVDVNGFRLRHAYVKLNWKSRELLFGQTWHPLFVAANFPGVVSFNTGSPFQPFSRNPQIRFTQKFGKFSLMAAACSQRDFVSPGGSSLSLRNSAIPDMNLQFQYSTKNDSNKTEFLVGLGGGYKILSPRLNSEIITTVTPAKDVIDTTTTPWRVVHTDAVKTTKKYKVDETVSSYYFLAFMKYKCKAVTVKMYGTYGQNMFDQTMIGGYVITGISDSLKDQKEYTPLTTMSAWAEIMTNGSKVQFGLFGGYTQNLGAGNDIVDYSTTTRGADILRAYRVAPRVIFISGKFQIMTELEWTSAFYATKNSLGALNRDKTGVVTGSSDIANLRALFAVQYNF
jgi:hypothetical protein